MLAQWNEKSHLAFTATTCDLFFSIMVVWDHGWAHLSPSVNAIEW